MKLESLIVPHTEKKSLPRIQKTDNTHMAAFESSDKFRSIDP